MRAYDRRRDAGPVLHRIMSGSTSDDKGTKGKRTIGLQKVANHAEDEASTEDTVDWPKVSNR